MSRLDNLIEENKVLSYRITLLENSVTDLNKDTTSIYASLVTISEQLALTKARVRKLEDEVNMKTNELWLYIEAPRYDDPFAYPFKTERLAEEYFIGVVLKFFEATDEEYQRIQQELEHGHSSGYQAAVDVWTRDDGMQFNFTIQRIPVGDE